MVRPLLALLLLIIFLAVAFGLRTWQHLRATGSTGFHGVSGRPGSAEWCGGLLFIVGLLLGALAPVAELLGWVAPSTSSPRMTTLGLALTLIGILATYLAQVSMGDSWRIGVRSDDRSQLVIHGPFAVVRNPIFTCMLATTGGLTLLLPNLLTLASLTALFLAVELQVRRVEEPYLRHVHGDRYRDYAARVGRFLPGLGRLD